MRAEDVDLASETPAQFAQPCARPRPQLAMDLGRVAQVPESGRCTRALLIEFTVIEVRVPGMEQPPGRPVGSVVEPDGNAGVSGAVAPEGHELYAVRSQGSRRFDGVEPEPASRPNGAQFG